MKPITQHTTDVIKLFSPQTSRPALFNHSTQLVELIDTEALQSTIRRPKLRPYGAMCVGCYTEAEMNKKVNGASGSADTDVLCQCNVLTYEKCRTAVESKSSRNIEPSHD